MLDSARSFRRSGAVALKSHPIMSSRPAVRKQHDYRPIRVIGKGAFGQVFLARAQSGELVAIKKILINPKYHNREADIHALIKHRNCIQLRDTFKTKGSNGEIYENFVMQHLPSSLHDFILTYRNQRLYAPPIIVKLAAFQVFAGLNYIHSLGIVHRDIKPQNILIDPDRMDVKICDFGSAKIITDGCSSVSYIASRYYRAPELLLGCETYGSSVDIWAAGCVIAELLMSGSPLFVGDDQTDQFIKIANVIGLPSDNDLASFTHTTPIPKFKPNFVSLEHLLPKHTPPDIIKLLKEIFVYNPGKRPTASECMKHECFDALRKSNQKLPNNRPFPVLQE